VLRTERWTVSDKEAAQKKALALFGDGGAIVGANRITLADSPDSEPFWTAP
jgi:hypothetical protein